MILQVNLASADHYNRLSSSTPLYSLLNVQMKKLDSEEGWLEKHIDLFGIWYWSTRKTNKWVLEQSKPETALFYFGHIVKTEFFRTDNNAGDNRRQQEKRKTKFKTDWLYKFIFQIFYLAVWLDA